MTMCVLTDFMRNWGLPMKQPLNLIITRTRTSMSIQDFFPDVFCCAGQKAQIQYDKNSMK